MQGGTRQDTLTFIGSRQTPFLGGLEMTRFVPAFVLAIAAAALVVADASAEIISFKAELSGAN